MPAEPLIVLGGQTAFVSPPTPNWSLTINAHVPAPSCSIQMAQGLNGIYGSDCLYWRDTKNVVYNGSNVLTGWADQIGGTAATSILGGPLVTPVDATFGNRRSITFDGIDDLVTFGISRPAPGTEPTSVIMVVKQLGYTAGAHLFGTGNSAFAVVQQSISPQIRQRNNTGGPTLSALPLNTWKVIVAFFSHTTNDYLRVGRNNANRVTGIDTGTSGPGSLFAVGGRPPTTSTNYGNIAVGSVAIIRNNAEAKLNDMMNFFDTYGVAGLTT